ncbi:hypothetical protein BDDG_12778 [Blastomyces dermatitidis ATCC 18188]|uniref:Uncharacterized protein n=1 Tax=Ajellomyces dermatitidis (strain ATCC 18188 / CBS 674.68) TaxID=653446 RepID=A0A0J9ET74_AJEDA|nr:hypothetical protein BDDG_12778 [Blastomyces dermatitidis ATCC 18188]
MQLTNSIYLLLLDASFLFYFILRLPASSSLFSYSLMQMMDIACTTDIESLWTAHNMLTLHIFLITRVNWKQRKALFSMSSLCTIWFGLGFKNGLRSRFRAGQI